MHARQRAEESPPRGDGNGQAQRADGRPAVQQEAEAEEGGIDEHAAEVLRALHTKYKLGIVSNFAIPECVQRLLEQEDLARFFDVIVVSGAINKRKPHPEIFEHALKQLHVTAAETVFVGDTVDADIKGPTEVGMRTIYVDRRPQKDLEQAKPTQTIKSLSELPNALQNC